MSLIKTIGIIGLGRVGSTLAFAFSQAGLPLAAMASRDLSKAERLAATIGQTGAGRPCAVAPQHIAHYADLIFIATPDDAIAETCASLYWDETKIAIHCSGAQTLAVLEAAKVKGASVGSFHPLNSFSLSDFSSPEDLREKMRALKRSFIGVAGSDPECEARLSDIATLIGAGQFHIADEHRVLYHVAAVLASNFVNTLLATSSHLWEQMGYEERDALRFIAPLLDTACHNIVHLGPVGALTGPIARGDIGTVEKHIAALDYRKETPGVASLYRALAQATLPLALAKGSIDFTRYNIISTLLQTEE